MGVPVKTWEPKYPMFVGGTGGFFMVYEDGRMVELQNCPHGKVSVIPRVCEKREDGTCSLDETNTK